MHVTSSLVPCTTKLQIDIKDRHGTNIQSMTLEIYVFLKHFVKYRLYIRNTYIENFNTFSQRA